MSRKILNEDCNLETRKGIYNTWMKQAEYYKRVGKKEDYERCLKEANKYKGGN